VAVRTAHRHPWANRRREQIAAEAAALSTATQEGLVQELLADMDRRSVHPSMRKRLTTSGWQHPMVRPR
jgi:hypothetical protein